MKSNHTLWLCVALLVGLACSLQDAQLVRSLAEAESEPAKSESSQEGLPKLDHAKFRTVNPEQIEKENELMKSVAAKMKRTYKKLLSGAPDEPEAKPSEPKDAVGAAKEKADKAMEAAKVKAKEKGKKALLKAKESVKKKNEADKLKAKERAHKRKHAFRPLKGGPVQQAAQARFDAYQYKLKATKLASKFAKKQTTKEELDRVDDLAKHAHQRAQYLEAQAIKQQVQKARAKEQLKKASLKAKKTMKKADAKAEVKGVKYSPWECTPESCREKCKTEHCLQWCTKCVTMKSEVMKFDPISGALVVSHMKSETVHAPHSVVPDIVGNGKQHLKELENREKEANDWVDRKLNEVKSNHTDTAANNTTKPTAVNPAEVDLGEAKKKAQEKSEVLKWASGVKKPSTDKEVAAEVHIKIRERMSSMIDAAKKHGAGFLELQRGKKKKSNDSSENLSY